MSHIHKTKLCYRVKDIKKLALNFSLFQKSISERMNKNEGEWQKNHENSRKIMNYENVLHIPRCMKNTLKNSHFSIFR